MAEKSHADELRRFSEAITKLEHQMETLAGRADRLEKFRDQIDPNMTFVTGARWIAGGFAVTLLGGIVYFAYWLGSLSSDVRHQGEGIAEVKKAVEDLRQKVEQLPRHVYGTGGYAYVGKVTKVSSDSLTIEREPPDEKPLTFRLTPETAIVVHGKEVAPKDLKRGMEVAVTEGKKGHAARVEAMDGGLLPMPK